MNKPTQHVNTADSAIEKISSIKEVAELQLDIEQFTKRLGKIVLHISFKKEEESINSVYAIHASIFNQPNMARHMDRCLERFRETKLEEADYLVFEHQEPQGTVYEYRLIPTVFREVVNKLIVFGMERI